MGEQRRVVAAKRGNTGITLMMYHSSVFIYSVWQNGAIGKKTLKGVRKKCLSLSKPTTKTISTVIYFGKIKNNKCNHFDLFLI